MTRCWNWLASAALAASLVAPGCSKPEEDPKGKEGDVCTVDSDCSDGLACRNDVCVTKAGGDDMGGGDGGTDDSGGGNNGANNGPIVDEDIIVSYILEDSNVQSLWVWDSASGTHYPSSPDGMDCRLGCFLTEDLTKFVTVQSNGPNFDILAADVGADYAASSDTEAVAVNVQRVEVVGNVVSYIREDAGELQAYYRALDGSSEVFVGTIGSTTGTSGDWHVDVATQMGAVYTATLQTMDVKIGALGEEIAEVSFTIDSSNYQDVSGSYFGGQVPTAFSPDGKTMAIVTQKAPLDTNTCESVAECLAPGERCGRFGRCAAIQVAVHFFDLENLENLGQPCSADEVCGPVHTCDIANEMQIDQATCIPRRITLGLPPDQRQGDPAQTGCELTDGNQDFYYSQVRAPLSFGQNGNLYLVAGRSCGDYNIDDTDILELNPTRDTFETVWGNDGVPFDPDKCWDPVEQKPDVAECTVWVQKAVISPGGNMLAFAATNPNVAEPALASATLDLWTVKRDGSGHDWVGGHGQFSSVKDIRMHRAQ